MLICSVSGLRHCNCQAAVAWQAWMWWRENVDSKLDEHIYIHIYIYIYICKIYIYIYACCRVKNWSKICLFKGQELVREFVFFPFHVLLSEGRKRFSTESQNWPFLKVKTGPIRLRNILGPIFDLCLNQFLTVKNWQCLPILVVTNMLKPLFYSAFSKTLHVLSPRPKNRNTICEHNCANWKNGVLFCILVLGGFCRVRFCLFVW